MADQQDVSQTEMPLVAQVRVSLLTAERDLLPPGMPDGYVLDLYRGVLTEDVINERVTVLLVEYARRCLALSRENIFPTVDAAVLARMGLTWEPVAALSPAMLAQHFTFEELAGLGTTTRDLSEMGSFVAGIALHGLELKIYDRSRKLAAQNMLWYWSKICELCAARMP